MYLVMCGICVDHVFSSIVFFRGLDLLAGGNPPTVIYDLDQLFSPGMAKNRVDEGGFRSARAGWCQLLIEESNNV